MTPPTPLSVQELQARIGEEIGVSPWVTVTQERIDHFAEVTEDRQFIHVDPERAATTPFGGTIAHGFLSLSLLSAMGQAALPPVRGRAMGVNYGFDKVRFVSPVRSGARVRGRFVLGDAVLRSPTELMLRYGVSVEIEGSAKPALVADWLTLAVLGA
ncbi:MAG TPA: MaoC family dehydratase [Microvirga sp.]|jgi:acyl dehydratase